MTLEKIKTFVLTWLVCIPCFKLTLKYMAFMLTWLLLMSLAQMLVGVVAMYAFYIVAIPSTLYYMYCMLFKAPCGWPYKS